jgi:glutaredoxin
MAWQIKDEYVDATLGAHVIEYENPELLTAEGKPQTHHRIVMLKLAACPHCGHAEPRDAEEKVDIAAVKAAMLKRLNEHHDAMVGHARTTRVPLFNVRGGRRR